MKKFLNSISVDTKNLLFNFVGGIVWFLSIMNVIEIESNSVATSIFKIVGGSTLLVASILLFFETMEEFFIKEDEMFIAHMKEAKAKTLDIVVGGLMWYCVMATFSWLLFRLRFEHDWRVLAFAVIGFTKLITFMYFRNLEKNGRSYF